MVTTIGILLVPVVLFALCKTQERRMEEERRFLLDYRRVLDTTKKR